MRNPDVSRPRWSPRPRNGTGGAYWREFEGFEEVWGVFGPGKWFERGNKLDNFEKTSESLEYLTKRANFRSLADFGGVQPVENRFPDLKNRFLKKEKKSGDGQSGWVAAAATSWLDGNEERDKTRLSPSRNEITLRKQYCTVHVHVYLLGPARVTRVTRKLYATVHVHV